MSDEILVGIEEEGFILNENGFLAPYSNRVAETLLDELRNDITLLREVRRRLIGIQWEPDPSQIEYVTRPLPAENIIDVVKYSRSLLGRSASMNRLLICFISMHPVESNPHPINGVHINISFKLSDVGRGLEELNYVSNYIRNYIPEIIAASGNSPIYMGLYNGYISNRLRFSRVLKPSTYSQIVVTPVRIIPQSVRSRFRYGILFERIQKYIRRIEVNREGDRLIDLAVRGPYTNILDDLFKDPGTTRIEVRLIDNQMSIEYLNDIIALIVGLTVEAREYFRLGRDIKLRRKLEELRNIAVRHGLDGEIEGIPLRDRLVELIDRLRPHVEPYGLRFISGLRSGRSEVEEYRIKIDDTNPYLTRLIGRGETWIEVEVRGQRNYYTLDGEMGRVSNGIFKGIIVPEYQISMSKRAGVVTRLKEIKIRHYLYTLKGRYIEITNRDRVRRSGRPIDRLIRILKTLDRRPR